MTLIDFPIHTHCTVCGNRLSPVVDIRSASVCDPCVRAGREFAESLGPEHETETAE